MVNYAAEADAILAELQRRSAMHRQDLFEIEQRTDEAARALEARATAEMKEFWEEHAERLEKARAEAEEKERRETELRAQQDAAARRRAGQIEGGYAAPVPRADEPAIQQHYEEPRHNWEPSAQLTDAERHDAELREQRAAVARAAAFRKANNVVRAVDDEDEDDEYYRRKSWLV